jgi:hypothetical protein
VAALDEATGSKVVANRVEMASDGGLGASEIPEKVVVSRGGIEPPTPCLKDLQATQDRAGTPRPSAQASTSVLAPIGSCGAVPATRGHNAGHNGARDPARWSLTLRRCSLDPRRGRSVSHPTGPDSMLDSATPRPPPPPARPKSSPCRSLAADPCSLRDYRKQPWMAESGVPQRPGSVLSQRV